MGFMLSSLILPSTLSLFQVDFSPYLYGLLLSEFFCLLKQRENLLFAHVILFFFFHFSFIETADHMVAIFNFFEEIPYSFPEWLDQFIFPQIVHKGSMGLQRVRHDYAA